MSFLASIAPSETATDLTADNCQVSAAALMYHVIQADGVLREVEKEHFQRLVRDENDIEGKQLQGLLTAAKQADAEAVDLYRFTSVLMRHLDESQRLRFIELLWELVYSDGVRHELEDNVVWRVSELLGIDTRDRVALRQQVEARFVDAGSK